MSPRDPIIAATFRIGGERLAVITIPGLEAVCFEQLTAAENEICSLMIAGRSNAEIAERRGTSINTVENQARSIYRKLAISSRTQLVALARSRSRGAGPR